MRTLKGLFVFGLFLLAVTQPGFAARFDVVLGSDYFVTQSGTTFMGVPFTGVPTGPGGSDTIVQRQQNVDLGTGGPTAGTTPLLMTQLELVTTAPTDFGLGVGFYYITLQSNRTGGGTASTGTLTVSLTAGDDHTSSVPEGTFSSFFDVFFDIRLGSATGPIAQSTDLTLTNSGTAWDGNPVPADILVPGLVGDVSANFHTNKIQNVDINNMDFFPVGVFQESHPGQGVHVVSTAQTPEPGTMALVGTALLFLSRLRRRLN